MLLVTVRIIVMGPWLTYQVATVTRRVARLAERVIAGSRMRTVQVSTIRSVGGLVPAVVVVTMFAGVASVVERDARPDQAP